MLHWPRPLHDKFPILVRELEPVVLTQLPTPVAPLRSLGRHLGHEGLYVKRDDLSSDLYGGNKPRKLEFLLGEAKRRGVTTVVTMGGLGSNHLLATALHGRTLGLRTVGVVFPQPETEIVRRNLAADHAAGVELVRIASKYLLPISVAATLARVRIREGRAALLIPGGGSSPLGSLGFVNAGLEFASQVAAGEAPEPERVFLPFGTGGTAAGLALGFQLGGLATKVVAVRVIDRLLANRPRLRRLTRGVARFCGSKDRAVALPNRPGSNLEILHDYLGPGYGHKTAESERAVDLFRALENLELEWTYSGKAAAAFIDEARRCARPLLFWLTYSSAKLDGLEGRQCS